MKVTIHVVKHCKTMIPHLHLRIQNHTAFSLVYPCQKAKILKKVTKKSVQIASFCAFCFVLLFCFVGFVDFVASGLLHWLHVNPNYSFPTIHHFYGLFYGKFSSKICQKIRRKIKPEFHNDKKCKPFSKSK